MIRKRSKTLPGCLFRCLAILIALMFAACTVAKEQPPPQAEEKVAPAAQTTTLRASSYGKGDGLQGQKTASGEKFDAKALTAASKTYPFGTRLRVTNPANGKSVVVRVNDRGPYAKGRSLDLSAEAARELGLGKKGVDSVKVEVLEGGADLKQ